MTCRTLPRCRTPSGTAYHEAGAGEPLVLVHGVGLRLEAWGPQIAALSRTHRVIAFDMPGHGDSAPLPDGSGLERFVDWLAWASAELEIARANVAGHSMGALIAGGLAVTHPDRVLRVALLNGVYRRGPEARAAVLARAAALGRCSHDISGPLSRWFGSDTASEAYRATRDWLAAADPKGYATAYSAFATGDSAYADRLRDVTCPALFLTGTEDANSTPAMAEAMAEAAPRGRARLIAGHGHMLNLTAPEAVNRALSEWLSEEIEA